jgi:hypothetical protein
MHKQYVYNVTKLIIRHYDKKYLKVTPMFPCQKPIKQNLEKYLYTCKLIIRQTINLVLHFKFVPTFKCKKY